MDTKHFVRRSVSLNLDTGVQSVPARPILP